MGFGWRTYRLEKIFKKINEVHVDKKSQLRNCNCVKERWLFVAGVVRPEEQ